MQRKFANLVHAQRLYHIRDPEGIPEYTSTEYKARSTASATWTLYPGTCVTW